ncbi:histone-fold-containing protein [Conidiobolus coronatus NRRL 28638]|uniref:DNA polymerase epsilon subunit D n=1 Tax=Conidiobolus coronatus (strain ATCC 28846 / CBS 209.66 / NRRL 28638) TaxID=796925 RepID=A0A137P0C1_CONC2|nr:histone-fold-containing protein [Conidiobolus coronatus NRRL 28638]|eukprot:KXN68540.1 histone-fold-containing protein [Conidiobolus coronatus NRRL 28638]
MEDSTNNTPHELLETPNTAVIEEQLEKTKETSQSEQIQQDIQITLDDLTLPQNTVVKIVKEKFPKNIKIQHEAKAAITRSSTVFINHLAAVAQEFTMKNNRKYITVTDVINALEVLEFDQFSNYVQSSAAEFKTSAQEKKAKKLNSNTAEDAANGEDEDDELNDDQMTVSNPNTPPHTK